MEVLFGSLKWTLFLDRDGVINTRLPDDYVKTPEDFKFLPGVKDAMKILTNIFDPIIVVTNQQGIGKGLMTEVQLEKIHNEMRSEVEQGGGRIDAIYFCPDLKNSGSFYRKPAIGMGLRARKEFPGINFKRSIMAGDSYSDILFGYRLGMKTALISEDSNLRFKCGDMLDFSFPDLKSFAFHTHNLRECNK